MHKIFLLYLITLVRMLLTRVTSNTYMTTRMFNMDTAIIIKEKNSLDLEF